MTPVVMMEATGRSGGGRESGNAERAGGDQTKCKLTKHLHSPFGARAIVASLHFGRDETRSRSWQAGKIVFQECFVGCGKMCRDQAFRAAR
jgi:hypothetical protein